MLKRTREYQYSIITSKQITSAHTNLLRGLLLWRKKYWLLFLRRAYITTLFWALWGCWFWKKLWVQVLTRYLCMNSVSQYRLDCRLLQRYAQELKLASVYMMSLPWDQLHFVTFETSFWSWVGENDAKDSFAPHLWWSFVDITIN